MRPGQGMKAHALDALWQAFVFVLAIGAAIIRMRNGGTWAPAGLILLATISYANLNDSTAKIRAMR